MTHPLSPNLRRASHPSSPSARAGAAAQEAAGGDVGDVLARDAGRHPVHPDVLDTGAADDEAVGAPRLVVHPFRQVDADGGGVEGHEVGVEPLRHEAAVGDAERPVRGGL
jgi:hypothetical protein